MTRLALSAAHRRSTPDRHGFDTCAVAARGRCYGRTHPARAAHPVNGVPALRHTRPATFWPCGTQGQHRFGPVARRSASSGLAAHTPNSLCPCGPQGQHRPGLWDRRLGLVAHTATNVSALRHARPTTCWPCAPQGQPRFSPVAHTNASSGLAAHTPNSFCPCVPQGQHKPGPWLRYAGTAKRRAVVGGDPSQDAPYDTSYTTTYDTAYATAWRRALACGVAAAFAAHASRTCRPWAAQRRNRSASAPQCARGAA